MPTPRDQMLQEQVEAQERLAADRLAEFHMITLLEAWLDDESDVDAGIVVDELQDYLIYR